MTSAGSATLRSNPPTRVRYPAVFALLVGAAVVGAVAVPAALAPFDPFAVDVSQRLMAPSLQHWFGTDELGRDLFSRVVFGARQSLLTALVALALAFGTSALLGLISGYLGGVVDRILMGMIDVLLALPSLLIALLIVAGLGSGPAKMAAAIGIASVPAFTRVTRAEVMRVRRQPFVEAAVGYGLPAYRILSRHVLPHVRAPLTALAALEFATMVLSVATLSFLGYGPKPPAPEWGTLIAAGRDYVATAWWLTVLPGAVLAVAVIALHRVGRGLGRTEIDLA